MMVTRAVVLMAVLAMQGRAPSRAPVELSLDLMGIPSPPPEPNGGTQAGCGCVSGTSDLPAAPAVKVTLAQVSPTIFAAGDHIVVELLVDNVGAAPIGIATTRDPRLAPSCARTADGVRTNFALQAKGSHEVIAVGPMLYGSTQKLGTTMTVTPGERLRVRVPAGVVAGGHPRAPLDGPEPVSVEAVFDVEWGICNAIYERSASAPVLLSRPWR